MLTTNDNSVLTQIFDPESAPTANIQIDDTLPADPLIIDTCTWAEIKRQERIIILQVETIIENKESRENLAQLATDMEDLIEAYPNAACLLNDYAQILRLLYGNDLISGANPMAATKVRKSLDRAVQLLTPSMAFSTLSPAQARTLAQAHTQRGALLHSMAKACTHSEPERSTSLQEAASHDFFLGGRYGNEIAKALAVHANPTAKLCGQMVQNAMRKEFAAAREATI